MSATATPPASRKLSRPFYLLRTPDGRGHYFSREVQRALFGPNDPLMRFLVKARLDDNDRPNEIHYDFGGLPADSLAPMKFVPPAELRALEAATTSFLERAGKNASGVTAFEKELRAGFRVPDPETEPDCFWVYGPPHNQKLLILWGCEFQPNTSLPLAPHPAVPQGRTLLEALKTREMPADAREEAAMNLATNPSEMLGGHLLRSRLDPAGRVSGYTLGDRSVPTSDFKPAKYFSPKLVSEFEDAARRYYGVARVEGPEDHVRKHLRLPDPDRHPKRYGTVKTSDGKRLAVVVDPPVSPSDTLAATDDAALGLPAPGPGGTLEPTVTQRLWKKKAPVKTMIAAAASIVLLLSVAAIYFGFFGDREPPRLEDIIAENDPNLVRIIYSEPIAPSSLADPSGEGAEPTFMIRDEDDRIVEILSRRIDDLDTNMIVLEVETLSEQDYELTIGPGIADASPRRNQVGEREEEDFEFRDTLPPVLGTVSAWGRDGTELILAFNEDLEERSATNPNVFEISGVRITSARLAEGEPNKVILQLDQAFEDGDSFVLQIDGLGDDAYRSNEIEEFSSEYVYTDVLPPVLVDIKAVQAQDEVFLTFSERLLEASAQDPSRYRIANPKTGEELSVNRATYTPVLGDTTSTVVLNLGNLMQRGIEYELRIDGVRDAAPRNNPLTSEEPRKFIFNGTVDDQGPELAVVRVLPNGTSVLLRYDETVDRARAISADAYGFEPEVSVASVEPRNADSTDFQLTLATPLERGVGYTLTVRNLADRLGNVSQEIVREDVRMPNVRTIGSVDVLGIEGVTASADRSVVTVTFSEPVDPEHLADVERFQINPNVAIRSAAPVEGRPSTVQLNLLRPLQPNARYELVATNLGLADNPEQSQARISEQFTTSLTGPTGVPAP